MELALNALSNQLNQLNKQIELKDAEIARLREQLARGSFSAEEAPTKATKAKKAKKEKDPNAPKKPSTAWLMWKNEVFAPEYKVSNPGAAGKDVAKASGVAWKELSAEEKEPWEAKYREAKKEYDLATGKTTTPKKVVTISEDEPSILEQVLETTEVESAADSDEDSDAEEEPVIPDSPKVETKEERKKKEKAEKEAEKAAKAERKAARAKKRAEREAKKTKKEAQKAKPSTSDNEQSGSEVEDVDGETSE